MIFSVWQTFGFLPVRMSGHSKQGMKGEILMKKILLTALLIGTIGIFVACRKEPTEVKKESTQTIDLSETEESKQKKTVKDNQSEQGSNPKDEVGENNKKVEILLLLKQYFSDYRWVDDKLVIMCKNNNLTFREGENQYPHMKQRLSEIAGMQMRTYDDEAENIYSFAIEMGMLDEKTEEFVTQISTLDVQVRRADSVALSFLADSYADYGFIEDFRGLWGSNYDTQTGEALELSDVILDMSPIPDIVLKELNSHLWAGDFYSEDVVDEYFKNTTSDGISWTLDYDGVTFYFAAGDLAEPGNGHMTAKVSFAEYPEIFNRKYMNVPEAYIVRMPLDLPYYADLDGNGDLETLECSGYYDDAGRYYTDFGIYTDLDGYYHYEEVFAYGFQPYYVNTSDNNNYIYLFCEGCESANNQIRLIVYNVNDGKLIKVGESNVAPAYMAENTYFLPLNPDCLILDDFDTNEEACIFPVGNTGIPVREK